MSNADPATETAEATSEKLVELAKRRGYFFQSSGAYGASAASTPSARRAHP